MSGGDLCLREGSFSLLAPSGRVVAYTSECHQGASRSESVPLNEQLPTELCLEKRDFSVTETHIVLFDHRATYCVVAFVISFWFY